MAAPPDDPPQFATVAAKDGDDFDFVAAPPPQPRVPWGEIIANPEPGTGAEPRLEARVLMYPDKSRFFLLSPGLREEILSPAQFVALILQLKETRRFTFRRDRG